jgi:hypothetical protein
MLMQFTNDQGVLQTAVHVVNIFEWVHVRLSASTSMQKQGEGSHSVGGWLITDSKIGTAVQCQGVTDMPGLSLSVSE